MIIPVIFVTPVTILSVRQKPIFVVIYGLPQRLVEKSPCPCPEGIEEYDPSPGSSKFQVTPLIIIITIVISITLLALIIACYRHVLCCGESDSQDLGANPSQRTSQPLFASYIFPNANVQLGSVSWTTVTVNLRRFFCSSTSAGGANGTTDVAVPLGTLIPAIASVVIASDSLSPQAANSGSNAATPSGEVVVLGMLPRDSRVRSDSTPQLPSTSHPGASANGASDGDGARVMSGAQA